MAAESSLKASLSDFSSLTISPADKVITLPIVGMLLWYKGFRYLGRVQPFPSNNIL
jgi:hypothetical protein